MPDSEKHLKFYGTSFNNHLEIREFTTLQLSTERILCEMTATGLDRVFWKIWGSLGVLVSKPMSTESNKNHNDTLV